MNFFVVIGLIALAIGVALGFFVQLDPGYIRISWLNWLIETNIWIGFLLFLAFYFVFHLLFRSLISALAVKAGYSKWRSQVHQKRALNHTKRGLLEYAEGNWKRAQRHLSAAAESSESPLINYLAAAQAANELGDEKASDQLLHRAYEKTPEGEVAIGVTQAQLQLSRGSNEKALSTLLRLRKKKPQHPFVLKLLMTTYQRLGDWNQLADLLPDLAKAGVIKEEEYARLQRDTWHHLLQHVAEESARKPDSHNPTGQLNSLWDRVPLSLQKDGLIVSTYAQALEKLGAAGHADQLLQQTLRQQWSEPLVLAFGKLPVEDPKAQLATAESWLKEHEHDAALLLTAGRICLKNMQWDKARGYFEASFASKRRADCAAELGRLLVAMGQRDEAVNYFEFSINEAIGLPDLPLPVAP
jgi:HemY protein